MTKGKKIALWIIAIGLVLAIVILSSIVIFKVNHPYGYDKHFILGNSYSNIVERYGAFSREYTSYDTKEVSSGWYFVEDSGPREYLGGLIVDGLKGPTFLVIDFDDGVAVKMHVCEPSDTGSCPHES